MFSPFRKSENLYSNFQKIEYLVRILKNKDLVSTVKFVTVLKLFACVLTNNILFSAKFFTITHLKDKILFIQVLGSS